MIWDALLLDHHWWDAHCSNWSFTTLSIKSRYFRLKIGFANFFLLKSNFRLECWLVIAIAHCINAAEFAFCIAYTVRSYVELQKCNLLLLAFLLCTFRFRKLNIRKMSSYMEKIWAELFVLHEIRDVLALNMSMIWGITIAIMSV